MVGAATERKWHPALATGNALRKQIDKGELISPEQTEVDLLRREPLDLETQEPGAKPKAPVTVADDDGLPMPDYVAAAEDAESLPPAASQRPPEYSGPSLEMLEMQRQLQEERQVREQLLTQLAEMEEARQREALARDINFDESEFSLTDPDEAKLIIKKSAELSDKKLQLSLVEFEKKLRADWEKENATRKATTAKQAEDEKWARINGLILVAVPEAQDIMKTPTYKAYANQRLEDGSTRLSRLQSAYVDGNTDYIVKVLNKVKTALPDFAGVTRVMPNTAGGKVSSTAAVVETETVDDANLSSMLNSVITGGRADREKFRGLWASKAKKAAGAAPQS